MGWDRYCENLGFVDCNGRPYSKQRQQDTAADAIEFWEEDQSAVPAGVEKTRVFDPGALLGRFKDVQISGGERAAQLAKRYGIEYLHDATGWSSKLPDPSVPGPLINFEARVLWIKEMIPCRRWSVCERQSWALGLQDLDFVAVHCGGKGFSYILLIISRVAVAKRSRTLVGPVALVLVETHEDAQAVRHLLSLRLESAVIVDREHSTADNFFGTTDVIIGTPAAVNHVVSGDLLASVHLLVVDIPSYRSFPIPEVQMLSQKLPSGRQSICFLNDDFFRDSKVPLIPISTFLKPNFVTFRCRPVPDFADHQVHSLPPSDIVQRVAGEIIDARSFGIRRIFVNSPNAYVTNALQRAMEDARLRHNIIRNARMVRGFSTKNLADTRRYFITIAQTTCIPQFEVFDLFISTMTLPRSIRREMLACVAEGGVSKYFVAPKETRDASDWDESSPSRHCFTSTSTEGARSA